jgi:basic membrane protein A
MKRYLGVFRSLSCIVLALIVTMGMTACVMEAPSETEETFKVAFVYIGPPGDLGWTYEHDRGRKLLEETLGDQVETAYVENVPEGAEAAPFIRKYAQQDYQMIFATSFGYMDPMFEVAQEFPDIYFEHCSGYKTAENMATYFGRIYQPRYLSGIVAGKMTQNNLIGYVAAFPIPEVIRGIDAFTLGVRSVNPEATVRVVWTSTWYDPVKEREAAEALLDEGVDIIAQHQDTTEPQKAAQERGALSIGYDSDMRSFVGDTVLTSPVWNWGVYYIDTVEAAINGEWETHQFWGGLADGIVELAEYSPKVPQEVRDLVEEEKQKIIDGEDVFCGPIMQQDGSELVPAGECMSDEEMLNLSVFVEGVVGTVPEQ